MKFAEIAVARFSEPGATGTWLPTACPPLGQPEALAKGPHTKKLTVPLGLPPALLPVTVAASVLPAAMVVVALVGVLVTDELALATVKHSPAEPSLEAE